MSENTDSDDMVSKARELVDDSGVSLNAQASAYQNSLDEAESQYGSRGVETQVKYLASNIEVTDEESRELKKKLEALADGEDPEEATEDTDGLSEIEFEQISTGFESFTEKKTRRDELITVEDFQRYAQRTGYDVEKVFRANPWMDYMLTDEARSRVERAKEQVEVDF